MRARPSEAAIAKIGGTRVDPGHGQPLLDRHPRADRSLFRRRTLPLWRLSVKSTTPPLPVPGGTLIEWGGALRWLRSDADPRAVRDAARAAGGHATLFRGGDKSAGVFHPLPEGLMAIHRRLKQTFDPAGILNPGRLYPDL